MNMRQLKRIHAWRRPIYVFGRAGIGASFSVDHSSSVSMLSHTVAAEAMHIIDNLAQGPSPLVEAFREGMAQAADPGFYCKRVKDDEVVERFETRDDALALVKKHIRGKKAKIYVTHQGEPVLFSEEEFA